MCCRSTKRASSGLREIPKHLPRRTVVHTPQARWDCLTCGASLRTIGQDVSEVLDYEPGTFHAVRHVRPKLSCARCRTITQAPAPSRPVDRCLAGAGLLTHILVSKFSDHIPLYRLSQIYARDGIDLGRSTITDWVGQSGWLLTPLAEAIGRYVLKAAKVYGDDTPIRALDGKGKKAHTAGCGSTCATAAPVATRRRQRCGSSIRATAAGITECAPCGTSPASCKPMRTRDTTHSTKTSESSRRGAGATRAARCGIST